MAYRVMTRDNIAFPDGDLDELLDESTIPVTIPEQRAARNVNATGRARFAAEICEIHGGSSDVPCAKFGQLPGNGRAVKQPSIVRILASAAGDLIKVITVVGVFAGIAIFGFSWIGHPHFLPATSSVSSTTGPVPNREFTSEYRCVPPGSTSSTWCTGGSAVGVSSPTPVKSVK